ncbi:MAG: NAD-dependent epimerase/dehydratase family protein [Nocardioidaceae bacterium]
MNSVVLVTGICGGLAGRLARSLVADPTVDKVVGIDTVPPRRAVVGVKFVSADIRNPVLSQVLATEDVDTVVHLAVRPAAGRRYGRPSPPNESNLAGAMQLLAACQRAPAVRKLVLKSSTAVYGASPSDPAMFTEEMEPRRSPTGGFAKDCVEVEGYLRGLGRRRPDLLLTTLRLADLLSPTLDTPLGRYLRLPVAPTVLGHDPRFQVLHEDDAAAVLHRAVTHDIAGTYNVAADGILVLSQVLGRLGRPALPVPSSGLPALRPLGVELPDDMTRFLTYGRGVDTTALRTRFGYRTQHSSASTLDEFAGSVRTAATSRTAHGRVTAG